MFRIDDALKVYLHREPIDFRLPKGAGRLGNLERLFDTYDGDITIVEHDINEPYRLRGRSVAMFRFKKPESNGS